MPIDMDFGFSHFTPSALRSLHVGPGGPDLLGRLRGFVGHKKQRSWKGTGFNLIWRPNHGQTGSKDFFLELNMTTEKLDFTDITGTGIANRGLLQKDIALGGIAYLQQVDDIKKGPQHFELGVWINVPATDAPAEGPTVAHMGSIPHGTTVNMQGISLTAPKPQIDAASITPFTIGSLDDGATGLVHFPEEKNTETDMPSRTPLADVPGLTDQHLANPNLFLTDALAKQDVMSTDVLIITSDVKAPKSPPNAPPAAPDAGGGDANIAFLQGTADPNANAIRATAIFWIERIRDEQGKEFEQLQYTQRVLLNFNGLSWPHVSVATLRAV